MSGPEYGAERPMIRVTSRGDSRRRGGLRFTRDPRVVEPPVLTPAIARAVLGDPELVAEISDGSTFVTMQGDDLSGFLVKLDEAIAAGVAFPGADEHADGLVSPGAKLGRDETAPLGGGRTGSGFVDDGGSPAYREAVTGERQPVPGVDEATDARIRQRAEPDAGGQGEPVVSSTTAAQSGAGVPVGPGEPAASPDTPLVPPPPADTPPPAETPPPAPTRSRGRGGKATTATK